MIRFVPVFSMTYGVDVIQVWHGTVYVATIVPPPPSDTTAAIVVVSDHIDRIVHQEAAGKAAGVAISFTSDGC